VVRARNVSDDSHSAWGVSVWKSVHVRLTSLIAALVLAVSPVSQVRAQELYFIDAHSQVDEDVDDKTIITNMDAAKVHLTILSIRDRTPKVVIELSKKFPQRILPSVTTKMWGYIFDSKKPHKKYHKALKNQVKSGKFKAMAEVLMVHSGCPKDKCPSVRVRPDDPRVTAALEAAVANGWPFISHIEFGSLSSSVRQEFMDGLEAMLRQYPEHPFALIHMGQLEALDVRRLIKTHKNIYFLAAHSNPISSASNKGFKAWIEMFDGSSLKPEWKKLMTDYPDRIIFALDNVMGKHWNNRSDYVGQVALWRKALGELPSAVANAVAHGNAERLWKLAPVQ